MRCHLDVQVGEWVRKRKRACLEMDGRRWDVGTLGRWDIGTSQQVLPWVWRRPLREERRQRKEDGGWKMACLMNRGRNCRGVALMSWRARRHQFSCAKTNHTDLDSFEYLSSWWSFARRFCKGSSSEVELTRQKKSEALARASLRALRTSQGRVTRVTILTNAAACRQFWCVVVRRRPVKCEAMRSK